MSLKDLRWCATKSWNEVSLQPCVPFALYSTFNSLCYASLKSVSAHLSPVSTWKACAVPSCACAKCTSDQALWDGGRIGLLLVKTDCLHLQRLAVLQYLSQNWAVWQWVSKVPFQLLKYPPLSTDSANSLALEGQSWHDKWAEVDSSFKKVRQISRSKLKSGFISNCRKMVLLWWKQVFSTQ